MTRKTTKRKKGFISKLLSDYGAIVEITSVYTCVPESFLPASKEKLKFELKKYYLLNDDTEAREVIAANYMLLANFVPLEDALVVSRYERIAREIVGNLKKMKAHPHRKDLDLNKKHASVQSRVVKEMKRLQKEVEEFA